MLEKDVEAHLVKRIRGLGGLCLKFTSPQRVSVPDRIVLLPGGLIVFIELKKPGGKPTSGQLREHERLRALGFTVEVLDSKPAVNMAVLGMKTALMLKGVRVHTVRVPDGGYFFPNDEDGLAKKIKKKLKREIHPGGQW